MCVCRAHTDANSERQGRYLFSKMSFPRISEKDLIKVWHLTMVVTWGLGNDTCVTSFCKMKWANSWKLWDLHLGGFLWWNSKWRSKHVTSSVRHVSVFEYLQNHLLALAFANRIIWILLVEPLNESMQKCFGKVTNARCYCKFNFPIMYLSL